MYFLYSSLLFLFVLVYSPLYFIKLRLVRKQPLHLRERMGLSLVPQTKKSPSLWIHAVSVGEVLSLQGLIKHLQDTHPEWSISLSTLTQSGYTLAKEKLTGVDHIFFVPLDFKWIARRFFERVDPDVFVLAESEFWPNLLRVAQKHTQAVLLVNGRISQRSCRRYRRVSGLMRKILLNVNLFQVQTGSDRERLIAIGGDPDKVEVTGNLKAEVELPELNAEDRVHLKKSLGLLASHRVVLAGSTHKGEDSPLLQTFVLARKQQKDLRLILAPRHLERVKEVEKLAVDLGLTVARRTNLLENQTWEVLILDTLGDLARLYAVSDIAFIGGSLIPWGGQNLLEPAFYGKPIYFGPYMENFTQLAEVFVDKGAAITIHSQEDLLDMYLTQDKARLQSMGSTARETLLSLQGAAPKALEAIERLMKV